MKLHRNAKSTLSSRLALVRRVLFEGHSYAEAAEGFAVSTRTVAKWVRRFKDGGVAALEDGSSRPGPPPHQTALTPLYVKTLVLPSSSVGEESLSPNHPDTSSRF